MLRMFFRKLAWLSLNSSRSCTFAFGKPASAWSSFASFVFETPPSVLKKTNWSCGGV
jgi:hypothetical protein